MRDRYFVYIDKARLFWVIIKIRGRRELIDNGKGVLTERPYASLYIRQPPSHWDAKNVRRLKTFLKRATQACLDAGIKATETGWPVFRDLPEFQAHNQSQD